jgi:hypothetical protein
LSATPEKTPLQASGLFATLTSCSDHHMKL